MKDHPFRLAGSGRRHDHLLKRPAADGPNARNRKELHTDTQGRLYEVERVCVAAHNFPRNQCPGAEDAETGGLQLGFPGPSATSPLFERYKNFVRPDSVQSSSLPIISRLLLQTLRHRNRYCTLRDS